MTDTVPAAATALPSRRSLVVKAGMLASIGAASALVAMPGYADGPGPIEAMHSEYLRLKAEDDAADDRANEAFELYQAPPRPLWHPKFDVGGYEVIKSGERRVLEEGGYEIKNIVDHPLTAVVDCSGENIDRLLSLISMAHESSADPTVSDKHAAIARRAEKTLDKIEIWQAEERRLKDVAGLTQTEAASERTGAALDAQYDAIFAIEATTIRELAFQAAILDAEQDAAGAAFVLERLVELAGITLPSANA